MYGFAQTVDDPAMFSVVYAIYGDVSFPIIR